MARDLLKEIRADLLPAHIKTKRVTELMDLGGKKAVVTGAGGPGLGQACAHRLAGLGAAVAVVDLSEEGATRVATEVRERWGGEAVAVQGNVFEWDQAQRIVRESRERLGGLDILVNNVGGGPAGPFAKQTKDEIDLAVHMTLMGTLYCSRAALDVMIPQRSGRIINVASEGGRIGMKNLAVYNACKSGVIGFTRNLAHEVAPYGIYVLGVCPGIMLHETLKAILRDPDAYPGAWESMMEGFSRVPLGRPSEPEEVANMVAFLASEAASYMCGVSVSMGGGMAMD